MPRLFLGNFDFEHSLGGSAARHSTSSRAVLRLQHELAPLLAVAAADGDFVWLPGPVEPGFFDQFARQGLPAVRTASSAADVDLPVEASPWGWTDTMRRQCRQYRWAFHAPDQPIIREANSRRFSLELEQEWNIGLQGATIVHTADDLAAALRQLPPHCEQWVLKAEFGMSARERLLGRGRQPDSPAINWLGKRLAAGQVAVLEPWVERIDEAGLQFTIPPSGQPLFEGLNELLCDAGGQYRGHRLAAETDVDSRWTFAVETGHRVARRLQQRDYFGPLGIDAMRYRDAHGHDRIRPVQDINARRTMGRLAQGLTRLLQPSERGTWLHVDWPTATADAPRQAFDRLASRLPANVRMLRTSPFAVDGQPVAHGSLFLAAPSRNDLQAAEAIVTNHG